MATFGGGLAAGVVAVVVVIVMTGGSLTSLADPTSLMLIFCGATGATLMGFQVGDVKKVPKAMMMAVRGKTTDADGLITVFGDLAERARHDGMLALESRLDDVPDEFVRTGLRLVVDGVDGDRVRDVLQTEIDAMHERHQVMIRFFTTLGGYAPTFGLMGTIIGLTAVLRNVTSPSELGKGMALALLTTLYGVMFANLVFNPIATKLERMHDLEVEVREMAMEGVLALREGSSPRLLVERLESYLGPAQRVGYHQRRNGAKADEGQEVA